ncbi:MAG: pilin [Magnetococcales bacterium]|nr:pilin [Magnetococcales bacterium]
MGIKQHMRYLFKKIFKFILLTVIVILGINIMTHYWLGPLVQRNFDEIDLRDALQLSLGQKVSLSEYYTKYGKFPDRLLGTTSARNVKKMVGYGVGSTYTITTTASSNRLNVRDKTFIFWTTDGGETWDCSPGWQNPVELKLLPKSCQNMPPENFL